MYIQLYFDGVVLSCPCPVYIMIEAETPPDSFQICSCLFQK